MGHGIEGGLFLSNRRLFAMPDNQAADGIKTDMKENVYGGCGDGVNVWSPEGTLLSRVLLEVGIGNLGFGKPGELFAMGDTVSWKTALNKPVVGATATGRVSGSQQSNK
jgi:gluconolactonase